METTTSTETVPHEDALSAAEPPKKENFFAEIIRFTLIALVIVIPVRVFVAQPFIVQGSSMDNTFATGQYLIVDQLTYRFESVARGDVVVFRYPKDPSKFFIKRVIGLPGDTVKIERGAVSVTNADHPEGVVLDEPYVHEAMHPDPLITEKLGPHEYFVMGDNRNASSDSRMWGVLRDDLIVGRAFIRLLPIPEISFLPGKYTQAALSTNTPPQ